TLESQKRQQYIGTARLPIIIDEFHRVAGADYRTLSELHKYGATFFLGTQSLEYLQKINPLLWPTLQANVRQFAAFNMSAQDANITSKELGVDRKISSILISAPATFLFLRQVDGNQHSH